MIYLASFFLAFLSALILLILLIRLLRWLNITDQPRQDRWHRSPTPKFGGVGIFVATLFTFSVVYALAPEQSDPFPFTLLIGMGLVFLFGLTDDIKSFTPAGKLITQIVAASAAVFFGYTTNFFSPRLGDTFLAQILNSAVSLFWLVAMTNAMNLLDNMDGLAGGISLIVCVFLGYFFWDSGDMLMILFCICLGGAILGFLFLNFPPAKIFMGDSGSQFLGYTLALLAIARQPQASNVFAIVGVPALLFTLPLADTLFVTITRWLRGQSPFKGGRDHTSHRLIAFGLSERQTLWVLYSIAVVGGITAVVVEALNYTLSLILLPVIIVFLLIFTTYLGGVKITHQADNDQETRLKKILIKFFVGRNLLDVIVDGLLISFSLYVAVILGMPLPQERQIGFFVQSLPLAFISGYLAFYLTQIYRDIWRHLKAENIYRYVQAAAFATLTFWTIRFLFDDQQSLTLTASLIYGAMLFLGLLLTRFSFQALDAISTRTRMGKAQGILVYASEETLEFLIPYLISKNKDIPIIGLVADQDLQVGKRVYDLQILGSNEHLPALVKKYQPQGIIIDEVKAHQPKVRPQLDALTKNGMCWVKVILLDLVDYQKYASQHRFWRQDDPSDEKIN
jgi:UDP-GlcNAc:undecaprenyl-phosphate GlcNAc-1-phosphate transferase